jgi:hypothetical protein
MPDTLTLQISRPRISTVKLFLAKVRGSFLEQLQSLCNGDFPVDNEDGD